MKKTERPDAATSGPSESCDQEIEIPNSAPKPKIQCLRWRSGKDRADIMRLWRNGVMQHFSEHARVLKVAWALEWLMHDGFAFPQNDFLSAETGVAVEAVQRALKALEDSGAIIRKRVGPQRRIYPADGLMGDRHGDGVGDRHQRRKRTVTVTVHNYKLKDGTLSSTMRNAIRDAELKASKRA